MYAWPSARSPADRPRLQQRLELPGLGPSLVVRAVAGQGADQRAVAALGPEVRVDGEDAAFRGGPRADADHPGGEPARGGQRGGLVGGLGDRLGHGLGHEDNVDVAGVIQLPAAALAHGHHGEPTRRGCGQLGPGHGERRLEHRGRDVGEFLGRLVDGCDAGQVAGGQVQQPAPVGGGQRGHRLAARADCAQHLRAEVGGIWAGDSTAQHVAVFRVPGQVVGQAGADAEYGGQPVAEVRLVAQRRAQGVRVGCGAEYPGQAGQREVGIGRRAQRGHDGVSFQLAGRDVDVVEQQPLGPRGIRETRPGQPPRQRGPRTAHTGKH